MTVGVTVQVDFFPGNLPKAVDLAKHAIAHAKSDKEPGCLAYFFFKEENVPDIQYGVEHYASMEAITVDHMNSQALKDFFEADSKANLRHPGPPKMGSGTPVCGFLTRSSGRKTLPPPANESVVILDILPGDVPASEISEVLSDLAEKAEKDSSVSSFWAVRTDTNPLTGDDTAGRTQVFSRFAGRDVAEAFWAKNGLEKLQQRGATVTKPKYGTRLSGFLAKDEPDVEA